MSSHVNSLSGITLRLSVCGIPTYMINPLAGLIIKWAECSGHEWTIKRLKTVKSILIAQHAGLNPEILLAKNRHGEIKGVVGSLVRWGLKNDVCFSKAVSALMAYSNWISSSLTETQKNKFLQAITATSVEIPNRLVKDLVSVTKHTVGYRTIHATPQPLLVWRGSPNKRAPTVHGSVKQNSCYLKELFLLDNESVLRMVHSHRPIFDSVLEGIDWKSFVDSVHPDDLSSGPLVAGEVHFLQEPGYKLRSIASPYRLFQVASEPLKNDLKKVVSVLPWDCTHDQGRAFPYVQKLLSQSKTVYSVDLSSATDMFPLELQEIVLQTIYGKENHYVQMFREISRASWKSDLGLVRWNKGQPLGYNPSFFTFTLTHGLLLYSLLGKRKWDHEFFVVGDDVLITDETLYNKYISTLDALGCPYSPEKSISSCKLAEFAGKIITPDIIIPQLKWKKISDDNFIDLARLLGPRIRRLLTSRQNKVVDTFAHLTNHVHPYGLDWSYPGSNLDSMIRESMRFVFEERVLGSLTGLSAGIHKQLYADYGPHAQDLVNIVDKDKIKEITDTFDEKVVSAFRELGYSRMNFEYFLETLKDLPTALSPKGKLPLDEVLPSRVTLLRRLIGTYKVSNN